LQLRFKGVSYYQQLISGSINNKMSAQRFNLTWDQIETSVGNSFRELLNDKDFTDVTLVTADDEQIKAHKAVLST
jgi:hypothetical protein